MSVICISSIETIGGRSIGFFAKKGRLNAVKTISSKCSAEDIIILFVTIDYLSLYGSEIKATFVNPEPESIPITSKTRP